MTLQESFNDTLPRNLDERSGPFADAVLVEVNKLIQAGIVQVKGLDREQIVEA